MKKALAAIVLAMAFVATAFAGTTYKDPNGATTFTQFSNGVQATNISGLTVDVRFVSPGHSYSLVLAPGQSQFLNGDGTFYEWTCPAGYYAVIQGTAAVQPTYDNHDQQMSCR